MGIKIVRKGKNIRLMRMGKGIGYSVGIKECLNVN